MLVLRRDRELYSDNVINIDCIYSGANPWRDLYTVVAVSNSIISFKVNHPRLPIKGSDDASKELLVKIHQD